MEYTDSFIEELLTCPKKITKPPAREMKLDRGNWKNNFELESEGGEFKFSVFIRYNDTFNENFSIGLDYNPREEPGTIALIRCNGPHGSTKQWDHHGRTHTHVASAETVNNGLKPESNIEITDRYTSWNEALQFFVKRVNIHGAEVSFPPPQGNLFDESE